MKKEYPRYELRPVTLRTAQGFVDENHRHNTAPQGHKFSIGLWEDDEMIGVVIVGRPIARANDDGLTAEITRCCVIENQPNANSLLYAAAWRSARGMGYRRIITPSESGASLKAAGFVCAVGALLHQRRARPILAGWYKS